MERKWICPSAGEHSGGGGFRHGLTVVRSVVSESQSEGTGDRTPSIKREHESSKLGVEGNRTAKSPAEMAWSNPPHYGTHIGYTTELEPMLFDMSQVTGGLSLENRYRKPDERNAFLLRDADPDPGDDFVTGALGEVESMVGAVGPALIRSYRNTINRYFPVVEEGFFQIYESRQRASLDPGLLAAVYLVAALVGEGHESASGSASSSSSSSSPSLDTDQLEDIAFRLHGISSVKPTLATVQAGVLLIQSPHVDSSVLNTQLVGIAYDLGLHLDCSAWKLSDDERGLRKRLAWALYVQDKWCCLIHGRPSLISRAHWAVPGFASNERFPDSAGNPDDLTIDEMKRGQDSFVQLVALTEILSTVLDTFYTLESMQQVDNAGPNGTRLILEKAKPVQIRLKEWFTQLPTGLKMDNHPTGKPSSTGKFLLPLSLSLSPLPLPQSTEKTAQR